jgi:hypothetical protein
MEYTPHPERRNRDIFEMGLSQKLVIPRQTRDPLKNGL